VILWLGFALGILLWVNARQTASVLLARDLREARANRAALEARRAELEGRARVARSRTVLVPRAEALGLRTAADSEIVTLRFVPEQR
jgi:hypothetical protein